MYPAALLILNFVASHTSGFCSLFSIVQSALRYHNFVGLLASTLRATRFTAQQNQKGTLHFLSLSEKGFMNRNLLPELR